MFEIYLSLLDTNGSQHSILPRIPLACFSTTDEPENLIIWVRVKLVTDPKYCPIRSDKTVQIFYNSKIVFRI